MNTTLVVVLFIAVWVAQIFLSRGQVKAYGQVMAELQAYGEGHLGVGVVRTKLIFGKGVVFMVVTWPDGRIRDARLLGGRSVFAKFSQQKNLAGLSPEQALLQMTTKKQKLAFSSAINQINTERRRGNLEILPICPEK